jgi:hypothetical protein
LIDFISFIFLITGSTALPSYKSAIADNGLGIPNIIAIAYSKTIASLFLMTSDHSANGHQEQSFIISLIIRQSE